MELKLLVDKTKEIFAIDDVSQLGDALLNSLDNFEKLDKFSNLVSGDLSKDWLQMIYQYYLADRKEKKQDYTPESLASLMGKIIGKADVVIDMCAGSGALTIQKWKEDNNQKFELFELDKKVIPFLLFNCVLRNIEADVYRKDVLQDEVYEGWIIRKGEKYGKCISIESAI